MTGQRDPSEPAGGAGDHDQAVPQTDRGLLMNVAYRLLSSVSEAEDAVQEAYIRFYAQPADQREKIASPTAWMVTTVSRICLDMLGSARARRERYVGEWLPEPVAVAARWTSQSDSAQPGVGLAADPADRVTLDESLNMALLVVLESMTPAERVAFVLHDVFRYRFAEIAEIVGRTPAACRQLASSARRRIDRQRPLRSYVADQDRDRVLRALRSAWEGGDIESMIPLLDPNVVAVTDGGGQVSAALRPLHGQDAVSKYALGVLRRQPDLRLAVEPVNGADGLVARDSDGNVLAVMTVEVSDGKVVRIWAIRNPEKLARWPRPL